MCPLLIIYIQHASSRKEFSLGSAVFVILACVDLSFQELGFVIQIRCPPPFVHPWEEACFVYTAGYFVQKDERGEAVHCSAIFQQRAQIEGLDWGSAALLFRLNLEIQC